MMTCVAIDDEPLALEVIERYCRKNELLELKATFADPFKAFEYLNQHHVSLVFSDINMPGISGMQLARALPAGTGIIFTTAYSHYAAESYDLNAVDYLVKPVTYDRFNTAVNRAVKALLPEESPTILLKSGPQTYPVRLHDIWYLEKDGNYLNVHTKERRILIRENMSGVFTLVPETDFIRVHKSYVVAIRHIGLIEAGQLTIGDHKIPVGGIYKETLRRRLGIG
jgi:two-component system LytT family response regulator